jgi:hypothetical protein
VSSGDGKVLDESRIRIMAEAVFHCTFAGENAPFISRSAARAPRSSGNGSLDDRAHRVARLATPRS